MDNLWVDFYAGDGEPDLQALADAGPPWSGVILKATQGTYYDGGAWFQRYWPAVKRVGLKRGCYHYVDFSQPAKAQADFFLATVRDFDLIAVDVERGGQRGGLSKQNVIDTTSAIVEAISAATGRGVVLYAGELVRSLGITDHMGCSVLWTARYTPTLPRDHYESMGWTLETLWGWQYCGKRNATQVDCYLAGYPNTTPAGLADITAVFK